MLKHPFTILGIVIITAIALRFMSWLSFTQEPRIVIREQEIIVDVARTPEDQQRGLSGRVMLPPDRGMLFVYAEKTIPRFWMKGMFIPLDLIWIADGRIVEIKPRVPAPLFNTPDAALPLYSPTIPVTMVLEVGAGVAEKFGWQVGDAVRVEL